MFIRLSERFPPDDVTVDQKAMVNLRGEDPDSVYQTLYYKKEILSSEKTRERRDRVHIRKKMAEHNPVVEEKQGLWHEDTF